MAFSFSSPAAPQPQASPFPSAAPQPQASPFPFAAPQPQASPFPLAAPQPQPQFQLQFQQQQLAAAGAQKQQLLFMPDGSPAGYSTKFEDLHADSQKLLLQIEERMQNYRDESERLDQCARLYDSSVSNNTFESDASRIVQEFGRIATAMEREKPSIQELMSVVNQAMRNTEFAIRSYMMLRSRFIRPNTAQSIGSSNPTGASNQLMTLSPPTYDFYSGFPKRPSVFMQTTVARFEQYLGECCKWIEELEQLVQMDSNKRSSNALELLPKVMSNVHDYFIYVAAKLENLHQYVESMKAAYLNDQRLRGDGNDPFLEANRREAAREEAAARRVHPTLHLPSTQPTTQISSILLSSATPLSNAPQPAPGPSTTTPTFSTPFSAPSSSLLFSTPTPFTPPSSSLFTSSGATPQSTPFGTASSSLFGSTQTPSGFGSGVPSLASTPAMAGSSLFSTPSFGAGSVTASGSSFGGPSKSSRPKSRSTRR